MRLLTPHVQFVLWFFLAIGVLWTPIYAQINCENLVTNSFILCDDFADGDFSNNPEWIGQTTKFAISDNILQLNNTGTDEASLITASAINNLNDAATEWRIYIHLNFSPSNNNNLKVYLTANQADLQVELEGYYLQIGENGSADAIELYRQNGLENTLILRGMDGRVADSPDLNIKIVRSEAGNWQLFTADGTSDAFTLEAEAIDNNLTTSNFFGILCKHSSTNADRFFFDNFYIGEVIVDNEPPSVISVAPINNTNVNIVFSEAVTESSATNVSNYILNGNVNPMLVNQVQPTIVELTFADPFVSGQENSLRIQNVADAAGNIVVGENYPFVFVEIFENDLIISEIFADPSPVVGLPEAEFVEIYNRTAFPISLENWVFTDNFPAPENIPAGATILPNDYLVFCDASNVDLFASYGNGNVVGIDFPSLNNSSDNLVLANANGLIINMVTYESAWYRDGTKDDGGYTLELINPENLCGTAENWIASLDENGGTPAASNSVLGLFPDEQAPNVINFNLIDLMTVEVFFDETIDLADNLMAYSIDNGIGTPSNVLADVNSVTLFLADPLQANTIYTLTINGISDCVGNVAQNLTVQLAIPRTAEPYDVLINEIFADFSVPPAFFNPSLSLPAAEFIELYNRSDKTIDLTNWQLRDASDTTFLGNYLMLPETFVLLVSDKNTELFADLGVPILGVSSFPSLNDSGDEVLIFNELETLIHSISYNRFWYRDAIKDDGGYTLELIDPNNPCEGQNNWRASVDEDGGTPGQPNSVLGNNADTTIPDLLRAEVSGSNRIILYFNEIMDRATTSDPTQYSIDGGIGQPTSAVPLTPDFTTVLLNLAMPLQANTVYTVTIGALTDCVGNAVGMFNSAQFGIPEQAEVGDLVINELLFNPSASGLDFVEIYNRSNKIINLSNWFVANADLILDPDSLTNLERMSLQLYSIFPQQHVVLANLDVVTFGNIQIVNNLNNSILQEYGNCGPVPNTAFLPVNLPSMNDDEGVIAITDLFGGTVIDKVHYNADWHYPLLDDENGVSLERIDPFGPSDDPNNWHSASATVCFATPGYQNSQFVQLGEVETGITLTPKVFSPDGDAYQDFLNIAYVFDQPNFTANATIFDERGRTVRRLLQNELLGNEGVYKWDGLADDGTKAGLGIYIIHLEIFDLEGNVQTFRETCVLAGQL